jgi:NADP-dependent 3-hydroxy acid dehydrogenase YdfG
MALALVTGGNRGIGLEVARELGRDGMRILLGSRDRVRGEAAAATLRGEGVDITPLELDVADPGAAAAVGPAIEAAGGRLDVLVNNAGVMLLGPAEQAPVEEWEQMVQVNVLGLLYCAKAALPHLLEAASTSERGTADLVNVSSVAGRVPRMGSGVYNATKFAVGAFSESLRQEVTRRHVRVGIVEPGAVATELAGHNRPEVLETLAKRFSDMQRLEAEDIADAIGYMVTRPRHVAVNELLVRPTEQEQ